MLTLLNISLVALFCIYAKQKLFDSAISILPVGWNITHSFLTRTRVTSAKHKCRATTTNESMSKCVAGKCPNFPIPIKKRLPRSSVHTKLSIRCHSSARRTKRGRTNSITIKPSSYLIKQNKSILYMYLNNIAWLRGRSLQV